MEVIIETWSPTREVIIESWMGPKWEVRIASSRGPREVIIESWMGSNMGGYN